MNAIPDPAVSGARRRGVRARRERRRLPGDLPARQAERRDVRRVARDPRGRHREAAARAGAAAAGDQRLRQHDPERRREQDVRQRRAVQLQRLERHADAADLPLAEPRPVPAIAVPGAAGRGAVRAGDAGPDRARRAGLLRRARGARQHRVHRRQQDRDRTSSSRRRSAISRSAPRRSPTRTRRRRATTSRSRRRSPATTRSTSRSAPAADHRRAARGADASASRTC